MKYILFSIALLGCVAAKDINGKVVKVVDGDTIVILTADNKQEKIRLADIDAPERGQAFAEKSRLYLAGMVAGKTVKVQTRGRDKYRRTLGTVYIDGKNVNEEMVKSGLAWEYRTNKNKNIRELHREAKRKKLGIFSDKKPINPYDWRKGVR